MSRLSYLRADLIWDIFLFPSIASRCIIMLSSYYNVYQKTARTYLTRPAFSIRRGRAGMWTKDDGRERGWVPHKKGAGGPRIAAVSHKGPGNGPGTTPPQTL